MGSNPGGKRKDPLLSFRFHVELLGITVAGFSEVSGLTAEMEPFEYREGGVNHMVHKLPGPARYTGNLILKRGITDSGELWDWFANGLKGVIQRRNGAIRLVGPDGETASTWEFEGAYPVKWSGPDLRGDGNTVAVESIELAHRGIRKKKG